VQCPAGEVLVSYRVCAASLAARSTRKRAQREGLHKLPMFSLLVTRARAFPSEQSHSGELQKLEIGISCLPSRTASRP